jgi:hypothetical protein
MLTIRIRREGTQILLQAIDGAKSFVLQLEAQAAIETAAALLSAGRQAEEWANAESIAADSAILMRSGAPFSLSDHPKIIAEAAKQAAWDSTLRRAMPGGVKSREAFGLPTLKQSPPRSKS